ncbi:HAMP domain-containing histidine kinase [Proteobacteria bacterium 005FR1]|nr:HAMP domain-containing histidine kinase [Proteobacteria bacterium 005FR1]
MTASPDQEQRVLVLAPYGRDGQLTCEVLSDAGIESVCCGTLEQLCSELRRGAGALIVAAEALHPASMPALVSALDEQPPWSDIPLVLATDQHQARAAREWIMGALERARHVTLLERPIRVQTLVSVVRSALSTRRRQYELRDLLGELELNVERLDAEHAVRERFVNLLAHDLRGPLGASKMTAELLAHHPDDRDMVRKLAARIGTSIDRADKMIRNLLDAHRLRAGQQLPVERVRCDLLEIVREVVADLEGADGERIAVQGPAQLEGYWDSDLLWRALWNLVTNAVKYGAPQTPITISLGCTAGEAWVEVHNLGPSIPEEEQRQLFQPFSQASTGRTATQHGWGLGLALVKGVATSHGGTLEVSSRPESGTAFILRLPLEGSKLQ